MKANPCATRATAYGCGKSNNNDRPTWLPSGLEVTFSSFSTGVSDIYVSAADGSGQARLLFNSPTSDFGYEWSPDGKYLVGSGSGSLWYLKRNGDGEWEKVTLADRHFRHVSPDLSPDGRYLAFESSENGRAEIWVRAFPAGPGKWLVSTDGGAQPRWKGDGSELFYVQGDTLMGVPVTLEPEFSSGRPEPLFEGHGVFEGRGQRYDVTADSERFVVVENIEQPDELSIRVVLNWFEEFREGRRAE